MSAPWDQAQASVEGASADCVATLGLSNAESGGPSAALAWRRLRHDQPAGRDRRRMTETAQLEAMSIAVQARTAAVMDADLHLASGRATGTGTDCVALACPPGDQRYAGLHTAVGEAIGAAVREVIGRAATAKRRGARPAPLT
jgi:hypothetical protein